MKFGIGKLINRNDLKKSILERKIHLKKVRDSEYTEKSPQSEAYVFLYLSQIFLKYLKLPKASTSCPKVTPISQAAKIFLKLLEGVSSFFSCLILKLQLQKSLSFSPLRGFSPQLFKIGTMLRNISEFLAIFFF